MVRTHKPPRTLTIAMATALAITVCQVSFAADSAGCRILTVLANVQDSPQFSPELDQYKKILTQKPFGRFNSFQLVKKQTLKLVLGTAQKLNLPQSLTGELTLNNRTDSMLNLSLSLSKGQAGPATIEFKATPGAPFFTAGFTHQNGTWIIGVICNGQS